MRYQRYLNKMNVKIEDIKNAIYTISTEMTKQKDYLIKLDQQNGDGDLGISMSDGFRAIAKELKESNEQNIGKALYSCSMTFNEAAPSSLGTIISFVFIGMGKALKGKTEVTITELGEALKKGISTIMEKGESKEGEKTILDSLIPAVNTLLANSENGSKKAFELAAKAAFDGSENTKNMKAVHGRAAYFAESSLGIIDGGSVVGKIIFESINEYCQKGCCNEARNL